MSQNEMIQGYAVAVGHKKYLNEEQIDELYGNFSTDILKECQFMLDYSGIVYVVYLTASNSDYYGDANAHVCVADLVDMDALFERWLEPQDIVMQGKVHFFHMAWYNGSDMPSIINV